MSLLPNVKFDNHALLVLGASCMNDQGVHFL